MLSIQGLSAGYAGSEILHGVDLEVGDKQIVALIGPNGSGKSTVLKSVFGLADVYKGSIKLENHELRSLPAHQLIKLGIAYVPQDNLTFPGMTVGENLEVAGYSPKKARPVKEVYEMFPMLAEKQKSLARDLSGGQQRLLGIARVLIQDPQLILLDEPSAGLAPKLVEEVFDLLKQIKESGMSILVAEQNAKQAVAICDNTYVLEAGTVKLQGKEEILASDELRKVFLGSS